MHPCVTINPPTGFLHGLPGNQSQISLKYKWIHSLKYKEISDSEINLTSAPQELETIWFPVGSVGKTEVPV